MKGSTASDQVLRLAVLESLRTNVLTAAQQFEIPEDELLAAQLEFLTDRMAVHQPPPPSEPEPEKKDWLHSVYESVWFELFFKMAISLTLALLFWAMPNVLKHLIDPLSNTIIWAGFTALYLMSFGSLGLEIVFWAMHNVNWRFFNRFAERGQYDYESFITSDKLTYYEKCQLNQTKYLAYLGAFCWLLSSLLGLLPNLA